MTKFLLFVLAALQVACSHEPKVRTGFDSSWMTSEQTRKLAEKYIAHTGFANAKLVEEATLDRFCHYRFATNNVVVAEVIIVDRKTGKVRVDRTSH
jgi:hypothetical protein